MSLVVLPYPKKLRSIWALILYNINYICGQSEWLRLHERMALSRREASLMPARARRLPDHVGTVFPVQASPTICASEPVECLT